MLLLDDGHCLRGQALEVCQTGGANEVGDFRAGSLNTLVQMVAGGIGITLLPRIALDVECLAPSSIVIRPFRKPEPSRTIGLVWRTKSPREHEFRLLAPVPKLDLRSPTGVMCTANRAKPAERRNAIDPLTLKPPNVGSALVNNRWRWASSAGKLARRKPSWSNNPLPLCRRLRPQSFTSTIRPLRSNWMIPIPLLASYAASETPRASAPASA